MADHVLKEMKSTEDYVEKLEIFLEFMKLINKAEYDFFDIETISMNRAKRQEFVDDIERDGIYIHQPPFFGNTSMEQFKEIYRKHPEWCTEYKFKGIERPMVMGDVYFIRLKHEPSNKSSMRSASNLNVKNLPSKSTLKKEKKILVSSNPLRLGEMETNNLLISKRPDLIEKLLKTYSTNETAREATIKQLLCPGQTEDGHLVNTLDMDLSVDLEDNKSISREILDKYLNLLGLELTDSDDDE